MNVGAFNIVPEVSEVVLISFNSFSLFFPSASFISTILSSTSLILSSPSVTLLLVHSRVLLISVFVLCARVQLQQPGIQPEEKDSVGRQ